MARMLFDHLNHIHEKQTIGYYDNLSEEDKKTFSDYMICRFVSMNPDYLLVVNEIQKCWEWVKSRELYLFLSQVLPQKKQFNKYIKATVADDKLDHWIVEILRQYFHISSKEAQKYGEILYDSPEGKKYLRELLIRHGREAKEIKKAGL